MAPIKNQQIRLLAIALIAATLTGCASVENATDDSAQVLQIAREWQDALAAERFGRALRLVSEEFASPAWPTKDALNDYFDTAQERAYFARANPREELVTVTLEDGAARIYPVAINADLGTAVFALILQQENAEWKITSVEMELY